MADSSISRHLRARKAEIAEVWERLVRTEVPGLASLDHTALINHLPEFLEGLARWIDGDTVGARTGFTALAEGHALQRLGYGIDLVTLTREYMLLRSTVARELMSSPVGEQGRELMLRMHEGMDQAIHEAVRRYSERRDEIWDRVFGLIAQHARVIQEAVARARRGAAGDGVAAVLRPVDMGEMCEEAVAKLALVHAKHDLALERSGDLRGMWDRDRVVQALSIVIARAFDGGGSHVAVVVREAPDHQSVITEISRRGPSSSPLLLPDLVRELVVTHGGRSTQSGATIAIDWPRTPLDEAPARV